MPMKKLFAFTYQIVGCSLNGILVWYTEWTQRFAHEIRYIIEEMGCDFETFWCFDSYAFVIVTLINGISRVLIAHFIS